MNKSFDELLLDILAIKIAVREFTCSEELIEWDCLRSKWD